MEMEMLKCEMICISNSSSSDERAPFHVSFFLFYFCLSCFNSQILSFSPLTSLTSHLYLLSFSSPHTLLSFFPLSGYSTLPSYLYLYSFPSLHLF